MHNHSVMVLGDIMVDQYHFGHVSRLNPESPNPLITITSTEHRLGGAGNVAANLAAMGVPTYLLGQLGDDLHAPVVTDLCTRYAINLISYPTTQPTITKTRLVETTYNQQLLRADFEEKIMLSKQQQTDIIATIERLQPDYLIIADYNKGVISDTLIEQLNALSVKILLDTKSYKICQFKNIFLLKPNFKEFQEIIGQEIANTDEAIESHGKKLATELGTNLVITRGKEGASLISPDGTYLHLQTEAKSIFDVSGAGDTFSAGVITALLRGYSLQEAIMRGNKASGIAVSKIGTSVVTKEELFGS